ITAKGIRERTIIQSFDKRTLQYLHQHYPEIRTALLIEDFNKAPLTTHLQQLGFIPAIYSPHYSLVTSELIQQCRQQN
ncbi:hypothetical protein MMA59_22995, partial [Salmonella enterica]|nr:hypothetical protein [Salmonella enterica]